MAIRAPDGARNGHVLPTGQWYAPSAVINDVWYCMVLHGIALYCLVLHGIAWCCMVLHGNAQYCTVLYMVMQRFYLFLTVPKI